MVQAFSTGTSEGTLTTANTNKILYLQNLQGGLFIVKIVFEYKISVNI